MNYYTDKYLFLLNNLNKLSKDKIIITHENRRDRTGSFLGIDLLCYAFSKYNNFEFQFYHIKRNKIFNSDILHNFMGLNLSIKKINPNEVNIIKISDINNINNENNVILFNDETKDIENLMIKQTNFNDFFPLEFRKSLYNNFNKINPSYPIYFKKDMTNIAIHMRRGDITPTYYSHAYFPNMYFINLINELNKEYKNANIHIFSCQTNKEGWDDFNKLNVTLHLRNDWSRDNLKYEMIDIHHFINADVLVIGGTFSYVPAFFNLNTIYYPSAYWHSSLKHWKYYKSK